MNQKIKILIIQGDNLAAQISVQCQHTKKGA